MRKNSSDFSDPEVINEKSSAIKRNTDRDSLFLTANLRFQNGGEEGQVRIRNLSTGGLMAEAAVQAARGTRLEIELKNIGWIGGKIAWVAEKKLGVAFDHLIDPKLVRSPIGQSKTELPPHLKKLNKAATSGFKQYKK